MQQFTLHLAAKPLSGWRLALAVAAGVLVLALIAAVAFAAFLVFAPIVAALALWQRRRWKRALRDAARAAAPGDVIDADFVVIEDRREAPR